MVVIGKGQKEGEWIRSLKSKGEDRMEDKGEKEEKDVQTTLYDCEADSEV